MKMYVFPGVLPLGQSYVYLSGFECNAKEIIKAFFYYLALLTLSEKWCCGEIR
jgi:hypothetical protein